MLACWSKIKNWWYEIIKAELPVRHIGGGHKQKYRIIDFKRDKDGITGQSRTIGI